MIQKSISFIPPILEGLSIADLYKNGLSNSYMGSVVHSGENIWGEKFYLEFNTEELQEDFLEQLRQYKYYLGEYDPEPNKVHIVFNVPEKYKETVITPFLAGKYSQIDRNYVNAYFPRKILSSMGWMPSVNYQILSKDPILLHYWKEERDIDIPIGSEVWSKPEKKDEIYGFIQENENSTEE